MLFTREIIDSFKPIELDIYYFVIANADQIESMKIRDLAKELHISTASILRFCKKVGCSGYSEFKFKLKESLVKESPSAVEDKVVTTLGHYFPLASQVSQKQEKVLNDLVDFMQKANRVIFIGDGTSGVIAKYGYLFLTTLGKSCSYIDIPFLPIPLEEHNETLVIALSVSGETTALIDRLMTYRELGAKIASITNGGDNRIAKLADYPLHYKIPKEEFMVVGINKTTIRVNESSQVPAIYLLESIIKRCVGTTRKLT